MSSDDEYSTDGKRKRNTRESEKLFVRSKKVMRTPDKVADDDDKLERITRMLQTLTQEVHEMRIEQKQYREEVLSLRIQNENAKKENAELKREMKIISERIEVIEKEKRRNNIVIHGLNLENNGPTELKEQVKQFIHKNLEVEVEVKDARKLRDNIHIVEMGSLNEKGKIMQNKNKLKNYKQGRVFINDDMTKTERDIQRKIRAMARDERTKGSYVWIGYQKIKINEEVLVWNKQEEKLEKPKTVKKPDTRSEAKN